MAKLTAKARNALAPSQFALKGGRYPIENASHARDALARVSQAGSSGEKAKVRAAVHAKYPEIGMRKGYSKGSGDVSDDQTKLGSHFSDRPTPSAPRGKGKSLGPHEFSGKQQSSSGMAKPKTHVPTPAAGNLPPKGGSAEHYSGGTCDAGGHKLSGMERAMYGHADKVHPVGRR